jgi:hypothetical protein
VRFRGGIAAAGGAEFASNITFGMGGVEARLGVQINDLIGVYAQPYLAFGSGTVSGITGFTGTAGTSALVDITLFDHLFVAAGGGYGVLNNPAGPELHFRLGGYPLVGRGNNGITRKGLMVGADLRLYFLDNYGTVSQIMFGVGYEAF